MIRKLKKEERQLYFDLADEFYHSPAVLHPVPAENYKNTFDELMRSDVYAECFIIEYEGAAAGFGLISKTFSQESGGLVVWIEELYIRQQFRSKGLGREFFEFLEKNRPASRYRLEIEPDNVRARALYERLGFEQLDYMQMVKDFKV
jgi:ribosomal protein S18 acetylase RimI-like enzyme